MQDQARSPEWIVYTDGSCWHKDRVGGWAWIAFDEHGDELTGSGGDFDTTISRMELAAPANALYTLRIARGVCDVLIYSDSEYVVKGANDSRRARNHHTDLWGLLDGAIGHHHWVGFEHVKGHADNIYNQRADDLAGKARKAKQKGL